MSGWTGNRPVHLCFGETPKKVADYFLRGGGGRAKAGVFFERVRRISRRASRAGSLDLERARSHENSHYIAYEFQSSFIRKKMRNGILVK
jgi:hypothetical protein